MRYSPKLCGDVKEISGKSLESSPSANETINSSWKSN